MYQILIVEDELFSRQAFVCSIKSLYPDQFKILETDNGLDALELCQKNAPDILLVDLNIPGISGLSLIQTLNDYHFNGEIIIITAHNRSKYIREAVSLGVSDYLLKPVALPVLKQAVDKCIHKISQKQTADNAEFEYLFSYTQGYLIHDILSNNAPEKILNRIYGWPENGQLCAVFLNWHPGKQVSDEDKRNFLQLIIQLFGKEFHILSAVIQGNVLLFLQAKSPMSTSRAEITCFVHFQTIHHHFSNGSLMMSSPVNTYESLYKISRDYLFLAERVSGSYVSSISPCKNVWSANDRTRLRQKFVQRLQEKQVTQLIQYLKKKFETETDSWCWVAIFMEALSACNASVNLEAVLKIFQCQNPALLLEPYLNRFYSETDLTSKMPQFSNKSEQAIFYIQKHFQEDLSQESLAIQLGLTPTYFSNIFKTETGKSFPGYLAECRIHHAVSLILSGQEDISVLTESCGFHNKKYFLETFKKYQGISFTSFLQSLHEHQRKEQE